MRLSKQDKTKAEIANKLQSTHTLLELWQKGEVPSEKLLKITKKDLKKAIGLIENL